MPASASLLRQLRLLLRKNVQIHRRNYVSTTVQLCLPIFISFMLFVLGANDKYYRAGFNAMTFELRHPPTFEVAAFPVCDVELMPECKSALAIVGGTNADATEVLEALLDASPQVARDTVAYYDNATVFHNALLARPRSVLVALHFSHSFNLSARPEYLIQYNRTRACLIGAFSCDDPPMDIGLPAQVAVERAMISVAARRATGSPLLNVSLAPSYAEFPHPEFPKYQRDMAQFYALEYLSVGVAFNFMIQLTQLVNEKELGLKLQLRMMGARDGPMWASWLLIHLVVSIFLALELFVCLYVFNYDFLTRHDWRLPFLLILLTYVANTFASAFFSALYHKVAGARIFGIALLFTMMMAINYFNDLFFTDLMPALVTQLLALFPLFLFIRGIGTLAFYAPDLLPIRESTEDGGMSWASRNDNNFDCPPACEQDWPGCPCRYDDLDNIRYIFPLGEIFSTLLVDCGLLLLFAFYIEQVNVAPGYGRAEPPLFFLNPRYWLGGGTSAKPRARDIQTDEADGAVSTDPDVFAEQERVLAEVEAGTLIDGNAANAISVVNLKKTFATAKALRAFVTTCGRKSRVFTAVARITFGIKKDSLFCLLGHNGAGKTTTFRMLSGVLTPTCGDAFVLGRSVRRHLKAVQHAMGLCPQHDVLWNELSAHEHLALFAGLAGLDDAETGRRVDSFLVSVDLETARHKPAGTYSGTY